MNSCPAISALINIFMLINFVSCRSVDHLVTKAVEEVKPPQSIWWTNFNENSESSSKHSTSYQLALKSLLSKTPTTQVNINTLQPFVEYSVNRGLLFNLKFSAFLHFIIIIPDNENFYLEHLKNVLKTIRGSIIYFSVQKFCIVLYHDSHFKNQNFYFPINNIFLGK